MNNRQILATITVAILCSGILVLLTDIEENLIHLVECNQLSKDIKNSRKHCS